MIVFSLTLHFVIGMFDSSYNRSFKTMMRNLVLVIMIYVSWIIDRVHNPEKIFLCFYLSIFSSSIIWHICCLIFLLSSFSYFNWLIFHIFNCAIKLKRVRGDGDDGSLEIDDTTKWCVWRENCIVRYFSDISKKYKYVEFLKQRQIVKKLEYFSVHF